jgi:protein tyrosine phosphatase (PTP) superfamily phosphohydrolase (DUF442 family)
VELDGSLGFTPKSAIAVTRRSIRRMSTEMAWASTLRSTLGFVRSLITRYTPLDLSRKSLDGIFNFLPISESLITSGQPTEVQFQFVKDAGFRHVINLAPHHAENALPDERATLSGLGMEYIHLPVDFNAPSDDDFARFCEVMKKFESERVLVHCAANMRVSAFMFRYRRDVLGQDPGELKRDLHQIWDPFGVWKSFIA